MSAPITQASQSLWALLPPVIAIVLALMTKEVYSSLFIGILSGGILHALQGGFKFPKLFNAIVNDGFIANLADTWNVGILVFLEVLGAVVVLMNTAGGSYAYGEWAAKKISSRKGASLSTMLLGCLIFVDDYFNCLTVGSVMRPVTDKHNISRAKLAYLIDASGTVEGVNGISLFIQTIPFNLYALLTLAMVIFISATNLDFGPMKRFEDNAKNGDLFTTGDTVYPEQEKINYKGKVIDLILPVIILIVFCVAGMVYTGGFFSGTSFIDAFAGCDAAYGLALGSIGALILIVIYYLCRKVLTFNECMSAIPNGFKQMLGL